MSSSPDAIARDVGRLSLHKKKNKMALGLEEEEGATARNPSPSRSERLRGKGLSREYSPSRSERLRGKGLSREYSPSRSEILRGKGTRKQSFSEQIVIHLKKPKGPGPRREKGAVPYHPTYLDPQEPIFDEGGPCRLCSETHIRCNVCYKFHHSVCCPYQVMVPKGARFNPDYELACAHGHPHPFNENKWMCTSCCGTAAMLVRKSCGICFGRHSPHECPEDRDAAAIYKLMRDEDLAREPNKTPYSWDWNFVNA